MQCHRTLLNILAAGAIVVPAAAAPGYIQIPGVDTSLKVYGFAAFDGALDFKGNTGALTGLSAADATYSSSLGYTPGADKAKPKNTWDTTAATSRIGFMTTTPTADYGTVNFRIEGDFAKANGTASTYRLRLAYGEIAGFMIGQNWSTFKDPDACPDYIDWEGPLADYYGSGRISQIRYTGKMNPKTYYSVALEKDQTTVFQPACNQKNFPGGVVGVIGHNDSWGHVRAAIGYQRYSIFTAATDKTKSKSSFSWNVGTSFNIDKDSLVAHVGVGDGVYGAGMQDRAVLTSGGDLALIQALQWVVGYTHAWTPKVRSTLFVTQVRYSEDSAKGMTGTAFKEFNQAGVNALWCPTSTTQFGAEYLWGQAKCFSSNAIVNPDKSTTGSISESKLRLQFKIKFY